LTLSLRVNQNSYHSLTRGKCVGRSDTLVETGAAMATTGELALGCLAVLLFAVVGGLIGLHFGMEARVVYTVGLLVAVWGFVFVAARWTSRTRGRLVCDLTAIVRRIGMQRLVAEDRELIEELRSWKGKDRAVLLAAFEGEDRRILEDALDRAADRSEEHYSSKT